MQQRRRRGLRWMVIAVAVAIVAVAGVVWWLGGDEPEAVDAGRALDQDRQAPSETDPVEQDTEDNQAGDNGPPTSPDALTGRWVVDTSRPFDGAAGLGTFVGYRVDEELANVGSSTAVGRTPDVSGYVELDGTRLVAAEFGAELSGLSSDDGRRDGRVQTMLGPEATASFELSGEIDVTEVPRVGEVIELEAPGVLRIRDVEREVTVDLQAAVTEMGLLVTGSIRILLEDYGLEVPSATIVLSASDEATLEWQLFLRRDA